MEEDTRSGRIKCSGCGSSSFSIGPDGGLVCDYCQTSYAPPGRICPVCGVQNPLTAQQCAACGRDLGMLDAVFARATGGPAYWLRQTREEAAAIKAREEEASQARLAEMWAAEQRRLEELARAQAERDRQARLLWRAVVALFFIVVALIIIASLLNRSPYSSLP